MNNFNEYECLKKIYLRMTILTAIVTPVMALFMGVLLFIPLFLLALITNIYIYARYYKKNDMGLFQENIKKILKKYLIALCITTIFLLPFIPTFMIIGSSSYYSMMMISVISMMVGILISWIYYLYGLIKSFFNLDKDMFYHDLPDIDNNEI